MKRISYIDALKKVITLYPTWFRWNTLWNKGSGRSSRTLYPTWFRWNKDNFSSPHAVIFLYIPHGSDETHFSASTILSMHFFISHMVQMKPTYDRCIWSKNELLYIPHGSDETSNSNPVNITLTCFISHMVQMKLLLLRFENLSELHLYIPHGSDETFYMKEKALTEDFFISHMVQMKLSATIVFVNKYYAFISHMVQMKLEMLF